MYAGASWIKSSLKKEMSPLGEAVANLLGRVSRGIYHLKTSSLEIAMAHFDLSDLQTELGKPEKQKRRVKNGRRTRQKRPLRKRTG